MDTPIHPLPYARSTKSRLRWALIMLGVATGLTIATLARGWREKPAAPPQHRPLVPATPVEPRTAAVDIQKLRGEAWNSIQARLNRTDDLCMTRIKPSLQVTWDFFEERKAGAKPYAAEVLSMRGKWRFVKNKLSASVVNRHALYLADKFDQYIFKPEELKVALELSVKAYVDSVMAAENQLLVDIRADLDHLPPAVLPTLESDAVFKAEFDRLLQRITSEVSTDVTVEASRNVGSFIAGDIAAAVAIRVASAVATRLGVSGGILTTGAAASWTTFGVSVVAAIAIDMAAEKVISIWHDPKERVAASIGKTLDDVRFLLLSGDDKTTGLRTELQQLAESRSKLRREALKHLILQDNNK